MVVASSALSRAHSEAVCGTYRLLAEGRRAAPATGPEGWDPSPRGVAANRRNLEAAVDTVHAQAMIPRRYRVEELFDDVTLTLDD